ncbi:hypothetical protein FGO68_gene12559 [Halteria grandinella]|uniref:Uncharacterized protein n=1 Tax=Halteria grandinella TaxID=5974 RepID=A0A8J8P3Y3_HALGN|nr:hypothetical protein FGO68_gene12559 [Halteria grandinella]
MEKKGGNKKQAKKGGADKEEKKAEIPQTSSIYEKNGNIYIVLSAKPGSKCDAITAVEEDYVGVSVQAPPLDGEANEGIREFVGTILGLKKRDIELVKGDRSHDKLLMLQATKALTAETVREQLREYMNL